MQVGSTGNIYIETRHAAYPHVIDFLVSCCEPVSRTHHMEQYRLDSSSLSAASAEGTYTCDMIRNALRYFRLDDEGKLPVDLHKVEALTQWASSPAAERDPCSYRSLFDSRVPQEGEEGEDCGGETAAMKRHKAETVMPPAAAAAGDDDTSDRAKPEANAAGENIRKPMMLSLGGQRRSNTTTPQPQSATAILKPLVALTTVVSGWTPPPLPELIETMLREEEGSSKMRIVLQPRLRRFQQSSAATATGAADTSVSEDEELHYFLVSPSRSQLDSTVDALREFLEPVMLHGSARWVLSDIDKGVEHQLVAESGRPAALRRLYASRNENNNNSSNKNEKTLADSRASVSRVVYKCQVKRGKLRELKESLFNQFGIRADCFYDYLQDRTLHVENLSLAPSVRLRPYQTASLERFRRGNRAHQGVVVLPCGAGKTLTGIGAAATMKKRTIVMCINNMSVFQWQREFLRWTNLTEEEVTVCTAKVKQRPGKVFITTYSMLVAKRNGTAVGAEARASEDIIADVEGSTWGLLLLDEVHTALANHFQDVLNKVKYKCVLGLSATLLREDDKIANLRHLVGPKLYEANWLELTRGGFLAKVECAEVLCPMAPAFITTYWAASQGAVVGGSGGGDGEGRRRRQGGITGVASHMSASNPYKLWATQALLEFHRNRSPPDKVIIFCDYLADVHFYARKLNLPYMEQRTGEAERNNLLQYFQHSDSVNALILTRVGDVALDIPCASVIIQISGLGASRRQEAQRLGRILRPKPPSLDNTCSYFYTLASQDTHEVRTSYERQSWLRDQGFAYRVVRCEQVLHEFRRVGGVPCCIGRPMWWYQVPTPPSAAAAAVAHGKLSLKRAAMKGNSSAGDVVEWDGHWWAPFSVAASDSLYRVFVHGGDGCTLDGATLGADTPRPPPAEAGGRTVGMAEEWSVQFSSTDAPLSFGTVTIGEGDPQPELVRRITYGQLRRPHDCLRPGHTACTDYALSQLTK